MNRPVWTMIIIITLMGGIYLAFHSPFTQLGFGVSEFSTSIDDLRRQGINEQWEEAEKTLSRMERHLDRASLVIQLISGTDDFNDVQRMVHRIRGTIDAADQDSFRKNVSELMQVWMRAISL